METKTFFKHQISALLTFTLKFRFLRTLLNPFFIYHRGNRGVNVKQTEILSQFLAISLHSFRVSEKKNAFRHSRSFIGQKLCFRAFNTFNERN